MNLRISASLVAAILAAFSLLTSDSKPNPVEAARLNNLGCAYMNQQLFEKGLSAFQQAVQADPNFPLAKLNEGIAYLNLQKIDEAKAALQQVIQSDPKIPNAWYSLGLLAKNTGDAQSSIDAFNHVTEMDPNDADTWYFLGTAYAQAKQFPQAIDAFDHALKINPLHASAEFGLSRAYQQSADVNDAREHLKKFQYITQKKIGAPMSLAYGEQGQYSRAVESPQQQLKPPPQIKVQFVDVTKEAGIVTKATTTDGSNRFGPAACFIDDNGRPAIFLADNGSQGGMSLYRNLGNGKLEDETKTAGFDPTSHGIGCTVGDYDGDGAPDLVVSTNDGVLLFHNEKNGTFKEVHDDANLHANNNNLGVNFIDYDHDGDLDLLVLRSGDKVGWADMFRNDGNGMFTPVSKEVGLQDVNSSGAVGAVGTDYNNDRAVDILVPDFGPTMLENPREGKFAARKLWPSMPAPVRGAAVLDFDHDGWMDVAFTHDGWADGKSITLWRNNHGKSFEQVKLPQTNWLAGYGIAAFDYDNDGWVDLVAVGETKEGKGEIKLFRNLGPDGFKDVTADVGLDKIQLKDPRAIITGDYDNDGATDLLITENHGPAVLLRNEGGNQNHWLRLALKGLADNKSAIGTKVEVFAGGKRQKFEIYGSNGYLGQNSPYLTIGLGDAKQADIVRMLWPTGVLQDEINIAGDRQQDFTEIDRRGSSCPTLFAWDGERYEFVADMLGAGVVGHWVGPGQRDVPRPVEWIKIPTRMVQEKRSTACHPERSEGPMQSPAGCTDPSPRKAAAQDDKGVRPRDEQPESDVRRPRSVLSFRFMEPLEEAVYLDQVRLL